MGLSFSHLLLLLLIVLIVFGAGRLPKVMGDIGKGVRSMREGLKGEDEKSETQHSIPHTIDQPASTKNTERKGD